LLTSDPERTAPPRDDLRDDDLRDDDLRDDDLRDDDFFLDPPTETLCELLPVCLAPPFLRACALLPPRLTEDLREDLRETDLFLEPPKRAPPKRLNIFKLIIYLKQKKI
jgi:hypothetical protein